MKKLLTKILDTLTVKKTTAPWNTALFEPYIAGDYVAVKKQGSIVTVDGIGKTKSAITNGGNESTICTLPVGYRPAFNSRHVAYGSGTNHWLCAVRTDGRVTIERYSNSTGYVTVPAGAWLPFSVTFFTN